MSLRGLVTLVTAKYLGSCTKPWVTGPSVVALAGIPREDISWKGVKEVCLSHLPPAAPGVAYEGCGLLVKCKPTVDAVLQIWF